MKTFAIRLFSFVMCITVLIGACGCSEGGDTDVSDSETQTDAVSETSGETTVHESEIPAAVTETPVSDAAVTGSDVTTELSAAEDTYVPQNEAVIHSDKYSAETPYAPTVLTYHLLEEEPFGENTGMFMRPGEFRDQINTLKSDGYEFMFADEYSFSSKKCVIISFDDGYVDNYTTLFPILKELDIPATIFVITKLVDVRSDYLSSAMIAEMSGSGYVHIGSHTVSHDDMRNMSGEQARHELRDSKSFLEAIVGKPVIAMSYPTGGFSPTVMAIASEYYNFAYTTVQQKDTSGCDKLAISRISTSRGESGADILAKIS